MNSSTTITLEDILIARINEIVGSALSSHLVEACEDYQDSE